MTCKDCIHYAICYEKAREYNENFIDYGEKCQDFANKSLYVKLPCKVGENVYIISKDEIIKCVISEYSTVLINGKNATYANLNGKFVTYGRIPYKFRCVSIDNFGKTVFFTLDKVEKALREKDGEQE